MEFITNNGMIIVQSLVGVSIGFFLWEHIARKKQTDVKPSVGIAWTATKSKLLFTTIGTFLAKISSFYTCIDLSDLIKTAYELIVPTMSLLKSPLKTFKGYYEQAKTYTHSSIVFFGSLTLIALLFFLYHGQYLQNINFRSLMPSSSDL